MQGRQRARDNVCEVRGNWSGVGNQSVVRVLTGSLLASTGGSVNATSRAAAP